jgi:hypothetical protein
MPSNVVLIGPGVGETVGIGDAVGLGEGAAEGLTLGEGDALPPVAAGSSRPTTDHPTAAATATATRARIAPKGRLADVA